MKKKCLIVFNTDKKEHVNFLEEINVFLNENSIITKIFNYSKSPEANSYNLENSENIESEAKDANFVISIGGDGTLLFICRLFANYNLPIIGVNVGKLGFITEAMCDELKDEIKNFLNGNSGIDERMMIEASIFRNNSKISSFLALNDFVIGKNSLSRISKIETFINENYICTYNADGLIISTPTGSTAYNLSAGGPILHPSIEAIILNPICNHSLRVRPLVVTDNSIIKIRILSRYLDERFVIDGQDWLKLEYSDEIIIKKASIRAKLVKSTKRNFFDVLKNKLHWID